MKPIIIRKTTFASGIAALMLSPVFAIEAPADNTPPPADNKPAEAPNAAAEPMKINEPEARPFLGVMASPIPDMVAEHLGIEAGQGVAVKTVAPDGPAAKAGLQPNDIITRIGEKPVSSQADVASLVGEHKPGDSIHLDIIQKGKAKEIDVTLGTRPAGIDAPEEVNPMFENLPLDGMPKEMADRIRGAIKGNLGGMQLHLHNLEGGGIAPEKLDELRKEMDKMGGRNEFKGMFNFQGGVQSSVKMSDGKGSVEMKTNKDGKEITVRDHDDKVSWSGPWDTEQDKEAAPPEVRERIDALNLDKAGHAGGMLKILPGMINPRVQPQNEEKPEEAEDADAPK